MTSPVAGIPAAQAVKGGVGFYNKMLFGADRSEEKTRKPRYPVKHPYYEDKEAYNLDACI